MYKELLGKKIHGYLILACCLAFLFANSQGTKRDSTNQFDNKGQKTGKWITHWKETNKVASIENFVSGKRNGFCSYYDMNGIVRSESEYKDDVLDGISKIYSPMGTLREISQYNKGKKEGITQYYNYKMRIVEDFEYHNNMRNGVHHIYYDSGRVETESIFIDDKETGTRKTYKDTNKKEIILEVDFVADKRVETRYYKNGRLVNTVKDFQESSKVGEE